MAKQRARDLGLDVPGTPGRWNAITDVPGVEVGVTTLIEGDGPLVPGKGPVRTGVTAILPRGHDDRLVPVWAGIYALNGNGEMTGSHWIKDGGYFYGPVLITNTQSVGMAHHAATGWMIDHFPEVKTEHFWAMPVVAETYDGVLNDITALHVTPDHAIEAIRAAQGGPVAEGAVGGGNGMIAYEFKAGTGTASRQVTVGGAGYTVGALVQANHGQRAWFQVLGKPVGALMPEGTFRRREQGSIIVVIATDAPLSRTALRHLARRAGVGVGRGGTPGGNSSGDIFLAFSTANPGPMPQEAGPLVNRVELNNELLDPIYLAAVEAVEEAVVNAIVAGEDCVAVKPAGVVVPGIDRERLRDLFARG